MAEDLGDRVHFARYCLPRDERGEPPSFASLERAHEISPATLSELVSGKRQNPNQETVVKIARSLGVSVGWLLTGEGPRPVPTGPVPRRERRYDDDGRPIRPGLDRYPSRERALAELRSLGEFTWASEEIVRDALEAAGSKLKGADPGFAFWFDAGRENLRRMQRGESLALGVDATDETAELVSKARKRTR